jgi:hypothetical protein
LHSGDDTYDLIDDALAKLAERRGAWLGRRRLASTPRVDTTVTRRPQ